MKRNINTTALSKDYILSKISEESIAAKYLDIPIETIINCITTGDFINSPLREDNHPSFGFTINNKGKLKMKDFAGYFQGDVFDLVAYILSIINGRQVVVNNKQDFYFILKHIAYTFSDIIDGKAIDMHNEKNIKSAIKASRNNKTIIELVTRNWNKKDKELWGKWRVSLDYLNTHFVVPVEQYYINRFANPEPKYIFNGKEEELCYAYILGMNYAGVYNIKLYFPNRNRNTATRFITNCNCIEGIINLELFNYDYIIITKSSKDRLSIGNHLANYPLYGGGTNKLNIGIVNLPAENYRLRNEEYTFLTSKLADDGMIFSLLDFDRTGREGARYLKENYDIPYLFITKGELGLPDYGAKDFAELNEKYSAEHIKQFVAETVTYIQLIYKTYGDKIDS